jgi:hypothetical protein
VFVCGVLWSMRRRTHAFKKSRRARSVTLTHICEALTCALSCLFWLGCVTPMRVPHHTEGPAGQHASADLNFLHVGSTTRAEVVQQMGWADAGIKNQRLFLGRWRDSKWVVAWVVAGAGDAGAGGGAGGAPRVWHTHNLIVEFDDKNNVVTKYHVFPDDILPRELSASLQRVNTPPLDLSHPIDVPVKHRRGQHYEPATLSLGKDSIELSKPDRADSNFKITPQKITGLTFVNGLKEESPSPQSTNYTLHFSEKTNVGKNLTMRIDMPALVTLVQYLAQNGVH